MKVNYYGIRGRCGFLHAACLPAFDLHEKSRNLI